MKIFLEMKFNNQLILVINYKFTCLDTKLYNERNWKFTAGQCYSLRKHCALETFKFGSVFGNLNKIIYLVFEKLLVSLKNVKNVIDPWNKFIGKLGFINDQQRNNTCSNLVRSCSTSFSAESSSSSTLDTWIFCPIRPFDDLRTNFPRGKLIISFLKRCPCPALHNFPSAFTFMG
jgi:hypothetical protein